MQFALFDYLVGAREQYMAWYFCEVSRLRLPQND
jgi:hypothetical protein